MPSIGRAFCYHWGLQTRSHTLPVARSSRRTPAWLPCAERWERHPFAFSGPYSRAAEGVRQDIRRIVGLVRPQPATATPAASSVAAGYCGTDPTGVVIAKLPRGLRG